MTLIRMPYGRPSRTDSTLDSANVVGSDAATRGFAERIAAALPPVVEEVVLTGSVSRGIADELSDIEMLVVTTEPLGLERRPRATLAAGRDRGAARGIRLGVSWA